MAGLGRLKGTFTGPGAPTKVPALGATSAVGPKPPALAKPRPAKPINTRDYGKADLPPPVPQPNPFGPGAV